MVVFFNCCIKPHKDARATLAYYAYALNGLLHRPPWPEHRIFYGHNLNLVGLLMLVAYNLV
jgi:hypothetical protein